MTETDFGPEMIRLYRGFAQENYLTPERMAAAYARWGFMPIEAMSAAVDRALTESKLPSGDWFDRIIHDEHDKHLESEREFRNSEAKRFFEQPRAFARPDVPASWVDQHMLAITALLGGERATAQSILAEATSSADLSRTVPLDGGVYLRQSGMELGLWPPNFLDEQSLKSIGWPWPEWPKSASTLNYMNARKGFGPVRAIKLANEADFPTPDSEL